MDRKAQLFLKDPDLKGPTFQVKFQQKHWILPV